MLDSVAPFFREFSLSTDNPINVGRVERIVSAAAGSALVSAGVARRDLGGALLALAGGMLLLRGATGRCGAYRALGVDTACDDGRGVPGSAGIRIERSVEIRRSPTDLYAFWRDLTNLPQVMPHVKSVVVQGDRSHWSVTGPHGREVSWEAEIINDHPDELIAWQSLPGADVRNAGSVWFEPADEGATRVKVALEYLPPAGRAGAWISGLLGASPEQQLEEDLLRFKTRMEPAS
jgi:Predicted integral membrane protein